MDPSNNKLLLIRATLVFYFTYKGYDIQSSNYVHTWFVRNSERDGDSVKDVVFRSWENRLYIFLDASL